MTRQITPRGPRGPYLVDGIGGTPLMRARLERKLTQAAAAEACKVTERTWRTWERQREFGRLELVVAQLDLAVQQRRYQPMFTLAGFRIGSAGVKPEAP